MTLVIFLLVLPVSFHSIEYGGKLPDQLCELIRVMLVFNERTQPIEFVALLSIHDHAMVTTGGPHLKRQSAPIQNLRDGELVCVSHTLRWLCRLHLSKKSVTSAVSCFHCTSLLTLSLWHEISELRLEPT